ncbi:MAG: hypothetical protein ACRCXT_05470 [Paraclostridium sp.]
MGTSNSTSISASSLKNNNDFAMGPSKDKLMVCIDETVPPMNKDICLKLKDMITETDAKQTTTTNIKNEKGQDMINIQSYFINSNYAPEYTLDDGGLERRLIPLHVPYGINENETNLDEINASLSAEDKVFYELGKELNDTNMGNLNSAEKQYLIKLSVEAVHKFMIDLKSK